MLGKTLTVFLFILVIHVSTQAKESHKSRNDAITFNIHRRVSGYHVYYGAQLDGGISLFLEDGKISVGKDADSKSGRRFELGIEDHTAKGVRRVIKCSFTLENGEQHSFPIIEPSVEHLSGMTRRYVTIRYRTGGRIRTLRGKISESMAVIRQWNVIGPLPLETCKGIADIVYAPERERVIDLETDSLKCSRGYFVRWQKITTNANDIVDLGGYFMRGDLGYAMVYLRSPQRQRVRFLANSDDGIELFVNGMKVHSHQVKRTIDASTDTVDTILEEGMNVLLAKISDDPDTSPGAGDETTRGWGFRIRVDAKYPLESSLRRFTE